MLSFISENILTINHAFHLLFLFFLTAAFHPKAAVSGKFYAAFTLIPTAVFFVLFFLIDRSLSPSFPKYLIFYLIFGALFVLLLPERRMTALTMVFFHVIGSMYIRLVVDSLLRLVLQNFASFTELYNLLSDIPILILILLYTLLLKRFGSSGTYDLHWTYQLIFISLISMLYGFLFMVRSLAENSLLLFLYMFFLLVIVLALYYLLQNIRKDQARQFQSILTLREENLKAEHISDIQYLYQNMRILRHEQKNILLYIKTLIKEKEYDKLEAYADELTQTQQSQTSFTDTGNILVNAILQPFLTKAAAANVPVDLSAALPAKLEIKDSSLISLLSNLLDNALENTDPENPQITIDLKAVKGYLSIRMENSVSHNILEKNPMLRTTKSDADSHGIGTQVIKKTIDEYEGSIRYHCTEDTFTVSILLPINTEEMP